MIFSVIKFKVLYFNIKLTNISVMRSINWKKYIKKSAQNFGHC